MTPEVVYQENDKRKAALANGLALEATMKPYNGHRSWNAWNVALWIGNDEGLYRLAMECLRIASGDNTDRAIRKAARMFREEVGTDKTPDGARYTQLSVYLALKGFRE